MADFFGKVVAVTGASSGIGSATARAFARRGATVVGVARREDRLRELMHECRAHAPESWHLAGDLGDRPFAESVVPSVEARHGRLDVLVNNAGMPKHKHVFQVSAAEAEEVLRVNFLSCVWLTLAAIPAMLRAGGGTIVNVSSFAAKVAPPREAVYAASKAAMSSFSEGLWNDLAGSGIHVVLVNPGPIDTEIWDKAEDPVAYKGRRYPAGDVAAAILDAVARRRFEITVPSRHPMLVAARAVRLWWPSLLRFGMAKSAPVSRDEVEAARARARSGGPARNSRA